MSDPFNCPKCGAHDYGLYQPNLGGDCPHCLKRELAQAAQKADTQVMDEPSRKVTDSPASSASVLVPREPTDEWADRFCEAVNWHPDGTENKRVEGQWMSITFRDLAKGYIRAMLAAAPASGYELHVQFKTADLPKKQPSIIPDSGPSVTPDEWTKLVDLVREEGRIAGRNKMLRERMNGPSEEAVRIATKLLKDHQQLRDVGAEKLADYFSEDEVMAREILRLHGGKP